MIEASLLFYGQPEELNSVLLQNLEIIEFRDKTSDLSGMYIVENRFGKEVLRKVSHAFESGADWLVYRYLSQDEQALLESDAGDRRIYVLLQNYVTAEYFLNLKLPEAATHFYIAGQNETMKPVVAVADKLSANNLVILKSVRKRAKVQSENSVRIPDFLAALAKLILNPVDELRVISSRLMHSNQRVLYRFVELIKFIHFLIAVSWGHLTVAFFWKPIAAFGIVRVVSIKSKYYFRHIVLMLFYKLWGIAVDGTQYARRKKDQFILSFYYRSIHRFYYERIHKSGHLFWFYFGSPAYYGLRAKVLTFFVFIEKTFYYKFVHRMYFKIVKIAGFFWAEFFSPIYYKTIHRLFAQILPEFYYFTVHRAYHQVLKPTVSFTYYKMVHRLFHEILKPAISFAYYKMFHRLFHEILKPAISFAYYKMVHRLIHNLLKPGITFVFYRGVHRAFHLYLIPVFTKIWYGFLLKKVWYGFLLKKLWYEVMVQKFYYDFLHRSFYVIKVAVVHRLWPKIKFYLLIKVSHFFVFTVKHYILMAAFKFYGLFYDLCTFTFRVTKLYLMYPVFKIYWFTAFQYSKRIKKFFV